VPLGNDAGILSALVMGGGAVVISVVDVEAPLAVFPQGAIPFSVIGLLVVAFETVGEGGAFAFVGLIFGDGACL